MLHLPRQGRAGEKEGEFMKGSNISERLNYIIKNRGLKQVEILEKCKPFCDKYGIRLARNDLSQYVSGKVEPKQDKLSILSLALDVSEAWLAGYNVPMERNIYEDHNDLKRKAIKDKFLESEFGSSLKECIMAWDNAINEFHIHPFYSEDFKRSYKVNYRCQVQWKVYKMAIKEFYGIEYFFTRTDEYFGVCTEDETDWLFKVNRADVDRR